MFSSGTASPIPNLRTSPSDRLDNRVAGNLPETAKRIPDFGFHEALWRTNRNGTQSSKNKPFHHKRWHDLQWPAEFKAFLG